VPMVFCNRGAILWEMCFSTGPYEAPRNSGFTALICGLRVCGGSNTDSGGRFPGGWGFIGERWRLDMLVTSRGV